MLLFINISIHCLCIPVLLVLLVLYIVIGCIAISVLLSFVLLSAISVYSCINRCIIQQQMQVPSSFAVSSPKSPKTKKAKRKRSKSRETTDIQRVMYKGQMIDVEDPSEQLIFAFMVQLAMERPCVDEVEVQQQQQQTAHAAQDEMEELIQQQHRQDEDNSYSTWEQQQRNRSAAKIQAIHQGRKARQHSLLEHQQRNRSAAKIQSIHRGRMQRLGKPKIVLSEFLVAAEVDASMAFDEIKTTRVGLTNVLRSLSTDGTLEVNSEDLKSMGKKLSNYSRLPVLADIIFDKWTATEDSFHAWRETMVSGQKLAWRSVCQLTMAQKNIIEERNDDGSFTKISKRRVKDLFASVPSIQNKEQGDTQVKEVELVLKEHLGLTMKLFAHYAGDAGSSR